ncbi:MAG: CvpA family protein [Planctomycetaceae bacterium]|nr:CvpA family protein [Planctomycetaceae bacterium]
MIDVLLLAIVGVVTWCVASEGVWGAAITFVAAILSGLVAMNLFEPVAGFLGANIFSSYAWQMRLDIIAFLGIFAGGIFGLRAIGEKLMPTYIEVHPLLYDIGRWVLGVASGYVVMAVVLTSLHTAPLPREFLGFTPERNNFFMISAPDRQWLAFTQYVSETSMRRRLPDGRLAAFDVVEFPANPADANTMQKWSSFPIRYAARREIFGQGGVPSGGNSNPAPAPPPTVAPAPSSGGGASGF